MPGWGPDKVQGQQGIDAGDGSHGGWGTHSRREEVGVLREPWGEQRARGPGWQQEQQ